ncbi:MAG: PIN domain-containing protein, partial [Acidobacteria bacterium]
MAEEPPPGEAATGQRQRGRCHHRNARRGEAVKFWDSSALVALHVEEPATESLRLLLRRDPDVIVWMLSSVEVLSAIARLQRRSEGLQDLLHGVRLEVLERWRQWSPVTLVEPVRRRAERLVALHPLAAADGLQLAAALVAAGDRPETLPFVTLDKRLATAAQLEGFPVVSGHEGAAGHEG